MLSLPTPRYQALMGAWEIPATKLPSLKHPHLHPQWIIFFSCGRRAWSQVRPKSPFQGISLEFFAEVTSSRICFKKRIVWLWVQRCHSSLKEGRIRGWGPHIKRGGARGRPPCDQPWGEVRREGWLRSAWTAAAADVLNHAPGAQGNPDL